MIVLAARHDMGTRRLEETNRLIVYVLDNAAAMATDARANPLGKFLCLFDLSGKASTQSTGFNMYASQLLYMLQI